MYKKTNVHDFILRVGSFPFIPLFQTSIIIPFLKISIIQLFSLFINFNLSMFNISFNIFVLNNQNTSIRNKNRFILSSETSCLRVIINMGTAFETGNLTFEMNYYKCNILFMTIFLK